MVHILFSFPARAIRMSVSLSAIEKMKLSAILVYLVVSLCHAGSRSTQRPFPGFSIGLRPGGFDFPFRPFLFQRPHEGRCVDPCKNMAAACQNQGKICRLVHVDCFIPPCLPVATCVRTTIRVDSFNPCRYQRPVLTTSYREYADCHLSELSCPTGTRCVTYNSGSKCCYAPEGCEAAAASPKPVILPSASQRFCSAPRLLPCRRRKCESEQDCQFGYVCCTNSCGFRSCSPPPGFLPSSTELVSPSGNNPRGIPTGFYSSDLTAVVKGNPQIISTPAVTSLGAGYDVNSLSPYPLGADFATRSMGIPTRGVVSVGSRYNYPDFPTPTTSSASVFREKPRGIPAGPLISVGVRYGVKSPLLAGPIGGEGVSVSGLNSVDRGKCPSVLSIKTCRPNMCQTDADCYLGRCCLSRCGKRVCTAGKGRTSFFG